MKKIQTPITKKVIETLRAGDIVYISGSIYTGRDAAHKKMVESIARNEPLPFDLKDQVIYYVGPTPSKPDRPIGSCGPTSSYRMDAYSNLLMKYGLRTMIGKGDRSKDFIDAMIAEKGVYLQAVGGAGALLSRRVLRSELIAYPELGAEAIYQLDVIDFPVIVTYDIYGGNLIEDEVKKYKK